MKIYHDISEYTPPQRGTVLTIGNFDGVHLGHQTIIHQARSLADEHDLELVVLTFDPPPAHLLRPDKAPRRLSTSTLKACWLQDLQIDSLIIQEPTPQFLHIEPEHFAKMILRDQLRVRHLVEGQTFNFGNRGQGNFDTLLQLQTDCGFQTHLASSRQTQINNEPPVAICSSLIRDLITNNRFTAAKQCLGRPYMMPGRIVRGRGDGTKLGFPTLNIEPIQPDQLIPPDGVFAGWIRWGRNEEEVYRDDQQLAAAVSIGSCQTFDNAHWQIEAHILNCQMTSEDLTGNYILLAFCDKLRDQQKFNSLQDLKEAIARDCQEVIARLRTCSQPDSPNNA